MKKKYIKRSLIFSFILIIVTISMSIGFAAYNINISITGDVHYDPPEAIYVSNITVNSGTTSMTPTHTINSVTVGNIFTGTNVYKYNVTFRNHTSTEKKVSAISGTNSSCTYSLDILNKNIKVDEYKTGVLTLTCGNSSINSTITFTFADYTIHKLINNSTSATNFLGVSGIANTKVESVSFGDYDTLIDDDDFMDSVSAQYNVETSNNAGYGIVAFVSDVDNDNLYEVTVGSVDGVVYTGTSTNFHGLTKLTSIDFTNLDTTYLTSMNSFLLNAQSLTTLDITSLNTSGVTNMYRAFKNLNKITSLNVSGIDVSKVTQMGETFMNLAQSTTKMSTFTINNWDASKATTMLSMFNNANVDVFDITINTPLVTNMQKLFYNSKASTFYINFDTSSVTDMSYMFYGCTGVTDFFDFGHHNQSYYTYDISKTNMYKWDLSNVLNISYMFANCTNLTYLVLQYTNSPEYYFMTFPSVTDASHLFENDSSGILLRLPTGLDSVVNVSYMYYNCSSMGLNPRYGTNHGGLSISSTSITDMSYMFAGSRGICNGSSDHYLNFTTLDIDTSHVTNMSHMFYNSNVNWVAVSSKWSTASLTTYDYMFNGSSIYDTTGGKDCSGSNVAIGTEKTFAVPFSTGVSGCLTPPLS